MHHLRLLCNTRSFTVQPTKKYRQSMFIECHRKCARMEFKATCGYTFELYLCFYMINTLLPLWTEKNMLGPCQLKFGTMSLTVYCSVCFGNMYQSQYQIGIYPDVKEKLHSIANNTSTLSMHTQHCVVNIEHCILYGKL